MILIMLTNNIKFFVSSFLTKIKNHGIKMHYFLFIFSLLNIIPGYAALDPYTPVAWPHGEMPNPAIHENYPTEIKSYISTIMPAKKITARYQVPPVFKLFEQKLELEEFVPDFSDIKAIHDHMLTHWGNCLPWGPAPQTHAHTGKVHQTCHNSWWDRLKNGPLMDGRQEVESTLEIPFSAQMFSSHPLANKPGWFGKGTAFMIGRYTALTAAHCVYEVNDVERGIVTEPGEGWYPSFTFAPAAYTDKTTGSQVNPFGVYNPKQIFIPQGWVNANHIANADPQKYFYDFALIQFDEPLGDLTGYIGLAGISNVIKSNIHPFRSHPVHIGGYPGSIGTTDDHKGIEKFEGNHGIKVQTPVYRGDTYHIKNIVKKRFMKHTMDVSPGQSGGPALAYYDNDIIDYKRTPYAVGITSHGNIYKNFSIFIDENIINWATQLEGLYKKIGVVDPIDSQISDWMGILHLLNVRYSNLERANIEIGKKVTQQYRSDIIARLAKKMTPLYRNKALNLHKYNAVIHHHPISCYYLARKSESEGDWKQAKDLYEIMQNSLPTYQDIEKQFTIYMNQNKCQNLESMHNTQYRNSFDKALEKFSVPVEYTEGMFRYAQYLLQEGDTRSLRQKADELLYFANEKGHKDAKYSMKLLREKILKSEYIENGRTNLGSPLGTIMTIDTFFFYATYSVPGLLNDLEKMDLGNFSPSHNFWTAHDKRNSIRESQNKDHLLSPEFENRVVDKIFSFFGKPRLSIAERNNVIQTEMAQKETKLQKIASDVLYEEKPEFMNDIATDIFTSAPDAPPYVVNPPI